MSFWKRRKTDPSAAAGADRIKPIEPLLRQEPLEPAKPLSVEPSAAAGQKAVPSAQTAAPSQRAASGAAAASPSASNSAVKHAPAASAASEPTLAPLERIKAEPESPAADEAEQEAARAKSAQKRLFRAKCRSALWGLGKVTLFVLCCIGLVKGVQLAKTLPYFNLTRLVLTGDTQKVPLSRMKEAVESVLVGNFFTANLDLVREAAEHVPWVKHAAVKRVWPDTLAIEVDVHEAMALFEDGRLVSTEGVLFAANPEEGREAKSLPSFYGNAAQIGRIAARYRRFGTILAPLEATITDVILSDRGSWSLVFESETIPPTKVELGQLAQARPDDRALAPASAEMSEAEADEAAGEQLARAVNEMFSGAATDDSAALAVVRIPADEIERRLEIVVKSYPLAVRLMGGPPASIDARYERAFAAGAPDPVAIALHAERVAAAKARRAAIAEAAARASQTADSLDGADAAQSAEGVLDPLAAPEPVAGLDEADDDALDSEGAPAAENTPERGAGTLASTDADGAEASANRHNDASANSDERERTGARDRRKNDSESSK